MTGWQHSHAALGIPEHYCDAAISSYHNNSFLNEHGDKEVETLALQATNLYLQNEKESNIATEC